MDVVTRQELMDAPDMTVFSRWDPCVFNGLFVKGNNSGLDFVEISLIDSIADWDSIQGDFKGVPFDDEYWGREGYFDDDQKYVVYSQDDIKSIMGLLQKCVRE